MNLNNFRILFKPIIGLLILLWFSGCSSDKLSVEGSASLELTNGVNEPLEKTPVILVDFAKSHERLAQRKEGLQMGLSELKTLRLNLSSKLDSLKSLYEASNYKDETIKQQYEAITDSIAALAKETKTYKLDYLKSIAKWLGSEASYKTEIKKNGTFEFNDVQPGKYFLVCVYEQSSQTGFLIKTISIEQSESVSMTVQDRDPILYFEHDE